VDSVHESGVWTHDAGIYSAGKTIAFALHIVDCVRLPACDQATGPRADEYDPTMSEIIDEQVTAELDGGFVVFRLGTRINTLWKVHKWFPIFRAARKMVDEVDADSDSGLLAFERRVGMRALEIVQYWRSFEDLRNYALDSEFSHAPSMKSTMEQMERCDDVGIWHELYVIGDDSYETAYHNTPPTGLGTAGTLSPAEGTRRTAAGRLGLTEGDDFSYEPRGVEAESVDTG